LLEDADAVVHYNGTKFDIPTLNNPITDIIDSYYIAKAGYESIAK
jgi:uncharacterized protein YprB with RNaseH-like and TPR domain